MVNVTTWICIKSHYQRYGKYNDRIEWVNPPFAYDRYQSSQEIADEVKDCDVVLFSSYIWNYDLVDSVARTLKESDPKKTLVLGGPHIGTHEPEFLKSRTQYDYICRPTKPGEIFFESLINQYFENSQMPDPTDIEWELRSEKKRAFPLPDYSIFRDHVEYLKGLRQYADEKGLEPFVVLETTRGCPYSCSYCEWGGGTNSKVLQKMMEIVKEDIMALKEAGYHTGFLSDANFGLFEARDIEIFRFALNNDFAVTDISTVKSTNYERRKRLIDSWFEIVGKKLETQFKENSNYALTLTGIETRFISTLPAVSMQSISDEAMRIAQRVDLKFEDKLRLSQHIHQRCTVEGYPPPPLELILGMPGSTLNDFYEEMRLIWNFKAWNSFRHDYTFLPDTTLMSPEYLKEHKIETVTVYTDLVDEQNIENRLSFYAQKKTYFKTVTSCFSFTRKEYQEMFFMSLAGEPLLRNIYPNFETMVDPPTFGKFCYSIISGLEEFEPIRDEIIDILNPETQPRSIKRLVGMVRTEAVKKLIDEIQPILFSELFRLIYHENKTEVAPKYEVQAETQCQ